MIAARFQNLRLDARRLDAMEATLRKAPTSEGFRRALNKGMLTSCAPILIES